MGGVLRFCVRQLFLQGLAGRLHGAVALLVTLCLLLRFLQLRLHCGKLPLGFLQLLLQLCLGRFESLVCLLRRGAALLQILQARLGLQRTRLQLCLRLRLRLLRA